MNARIRPASEKSNPAVVSMAASMTSASLCLALHRDFEFSMNGRCAKFLDCLRAVWDKYNSECEATRYETKIRVMCVRIKADSEREIEYRYRLREKRSEDTDTQDFLFMAAIIALHDNFDFHVKGRFPGDPSMDTKRLLDSYNAETLRWNRFCVQMRQDMEKNKGKEEDYFVDMTEWMYDQLRGSGMREDIIKEKIMGW